LRGRDPDRSTRSPQNCGPKPERVSGHYPVKGKKRERKGVDGEIKNGSLLIISQNDKKGKSTAPTVCLLQAVKGRQEGSKPTFKG